MSIIRPPKDSIGSEVTPEMIEAGVSTAWGSPSLDLPTEANLAEMVERIFRAMIRVRRGSQA